MYYAAISEKTLAQATKDLEAAARRHGLEVLHAHDLGATLRAKGASFANECRVFDVNSPAQAAALLSRHMHLAMALPCRMSVYTEHGQTHLAMITPIAALLSFTDDPAVTDAARDLEARAMRIIAEAK